MKFSCPKFISKYLSHACIAYRPWGGGMTSKLMDFKERVSYDQFLEDTTKQIENISLTFSIWNPFHS